MTSPLLESRRELRKCAFQALMSLEYGSDIETACRFAYTHDREDDEVKLPNAINSFQLRLNVISSKQSLNAE